jgi:uncharacterized protein YraI
MKPGWLTLCVAALALGSTASAIAAQAYVVTTVNLRAGAGTSHEIIAKIPAGSRVDAKDCKDGWCAVSWQGKNGFTIQTVLDMSGRRPRPRTTYRPGPRYYVEGPPAYYYGPPVYYYGPPRYYGPPYYYYRPYWRRHWWW